MFTRLTAFFLLVTMAQSASVVSFMLHPHIPPDPDQQVNSANRFSQVIPTVCPKFGTPTVPMGQIWMTALRWLQSTLSFYVLVGHCLKISCIVRSCSGV
ncbi:hypothetical protein BJ878DRAFT_115078 [Calycina marina]|uniref:Secreted protein n=1 Tax=Calycina marina TaxID=1763456 RepID=A0A9P7Z1F6_9HELO|nr:hypothetical protein BJ878DRAFT_115078 [Calycina marina]